MSVSVEGGGSTLAHYRDAFHDVALRKALWNTLVLAFWVGLASIAVGAPLAWLTARTDLPAKGLIRGLVMASFVTPPFLGAFAWVMLAGPNAGVLNTFWRWITGADAALLNIFTMPGLVFVVTSYTFPYVYIMLANTLAMIASDLEDAAAIHGAGRLRVALTITLPLVAPAIVSGFILAVLQALALFGSPAILALPAGFHTTPRRCGRSSISRRRWSSRRRCPCRCCLPPRCCCSSRSTCSGGAGTRASAARAVLDARSCSGSGGIRRWPACSS
jgi:iron(III) transport system permease protein